MYIYICSITDTEHSIYQFSTYIIYIYIGHMEVRPDR